MYATVADMRAEGVTEQQCPDPRLAAVLDEAGRFIDQATGWCFEPRTLTLVLDGRGTPTVCPPLPPIRIDRLTVHGCEVPLDLVVMVGSPVAPGFDGPRLTHRHWRFPKGRGNVVAKGVWGYTEPDGTPEGSPPRDIRRACILLALRMLPRLADPESQDARNRWRVVEERTRDQSYRLDALKQAGPFTGDLEIDGILLRYRRPAGMGAS